MRSPKVSFLTLVWIFLVRCSMAAEVPSKVKVRLPPTTKNVRNTTSSDRKTAISSGDYWSAVLEIIVSIITSDDDGDDDFNGGATDFSIATAQGETKLYGMDSAGVTCSQIQDYSAISCVIGGPWEAYSGNGSVADTYQKTNTWLFDSRGRFQAVLSCTFCLSGGCTSACLGMSFPAGSLTPSGCFVYIPDEQYPQGPCYNCQFCGSSDAGNLGANYDCFGFSRAELCYTDTVFNKNPFFEYPKGGSDKSFLGIITSLGGLLAVAVPLFYVLRRCKCIDDADNNSN